MTIDDLTPSTTDRPFPPGLARWLGLDAAVTGANGLGYLVLAGWLTEHLGPSAGTLRAIGGALIVFTLLVLASLTSRSRSLAVVVVVLNAVWVLGSTVAAFGGLADLTGLGRSWALLQAAVVAAFALLQARALRQASPHR